MTTPAAELRRAVRQCSERGLRCSSKWAAEQLVGLRPAKGGGAGGVRSVRLVGCEVGVGAVWLG